MPRARGVASATREAVDSDRAAGAHPPRRFDAPGRRSRVEDAGIGVPAGRGIDADHSMIPPGVRCGCRPRVRVLDVERPIRLEVVEDVADAMCERRPRPSRQQQAVVLVGPQRPVGGAEETRAPCRVREHFRVGDPSQATARVPVAVRARVRNDERQRLPPRLARPVRTGRGSRARAPCRGSRSRRDRARRRRRQAGRGRRRRRRPSERPRRPSPRRRFDPGRDPTPRPAPSGRSGSRREATDPNPRSRASEPRSPSHRNGGAAAGAGRGRQGPGRRRRVVSDCTASRPAGQRASVRSACTRSRVRRRARRRPMHREVRPPCMRPRGPARKATECRPTGWHASWPSCRPKATEAGRRLGCARPPATSSTYRAPG